MSNELNNNGLLPPIGLLERRRAMMVKQASMDYVKDGLVFWLDGTDASASEWVDRIGGYEFTLYNVLLDTTLGGVTFKEANGSYGKCATAGNFMASTHTIEAVISHAGGNPNQGIFANQISGGTALGSYLGNLWDSIGITTNKWGAVFNGKQTISIKPTVHCYINRNKIGKGSNDSFGKYNTACMFVGCRANRTYPFNGTIYQIRIYNRTLTEEEILYNQTIDINRYSI